MDGPCNGQHEAYIFSLNVQQTPDGMRTLDLGLIITWAGGTVQQPAATYYQTTSESAWSALIRDLSRALHVESLDHLVGRRVLVLVEDKDIVGFTHLETARPFMRAAWEQTWMAGQPAAGRSLIKPKAS